MKNGIKTLVLITMMVSPVVVFAADKAASTGTVKETADKPPQGATTYPCWHEMKDGHMMHMHGMMNGHMQTPPHGMKMHTCWDTKENGQLMHMHNKHMMWDNTQGQSKKN